MPDTEAGDDLAPGEKLPDKPSEALESQVHRAHALKSLLRRIRTAFPTHLASTYENGSLSFSVLDQIATANHLITSMLGRTAGHALERVELVSWKEWSDFQIELLQVLSDSQLRFLERIPWSRSSYDFHRQIVERFVGYLAVIHVLSESGQIGTADKARIQVGLQRVCRVLGTDQEMFTDSEVTVAANEVFGSALPNLYPMALRWGPWLEFVKKLRQADNRLCRKYKAAYQIAESVSQEWEPEVGTWIWWPHTEGRIATVVSIEGSHIEAAYEPQRTKKLAVKYVFCLGSPTTIEV